MQIIQADQKQLLNDVKTIRGTEDQIQVYLSNKDHNYWRIVGTIKLNPPDDPKR